MILKIAGAILISTSAMAILEPCLPIWLMETLHPKVTFLFVQKNSQTKKRFKSGSGDSENLKL